MIRRVRRGEKICLSHFTFCPTESSLVIKGSTSWSYRLNLCITLCRGSEGGGLVDVVRKSSAKLEREMFSLSPETVVLNTSRNNNKDSMLDNHWEHYWAGITGWVSLVPVPPCQTILKTRSNCQAVFPVMLYLTSDC